jgi:hypothetical protein
MKKQLVIIGIIALFVFVGLNGCEQSIIKSDRDRFVGTWNAVLNGITYHWVFFSNGSGSRTTALMNWTIKDEKLVIEFKGLTVPYSYSFSNNDKTLTLIESTRNATLVFNKQ